MQRSCHACGMPLTKKEDFAMGDENSDFCVYCTHPDGTPKSCEEVFEGGVQYFMSTLGGDRGLAEKVTRKNMQSLSYWKDKSCSCLTGDVVSDEEFSKLMKQQT